ncbi:pilus assembly protein MshP [Ectothiorhodospiraceae bacterium 2226]|nr:pilus assembly protein MshP [Ectothiorhodospiraceae bacterium 2226]
MRHHGFALVSVLFLVVVLTGLGAYMVTLSSTQHYTTLLGVKGAQAYTAAHAGIEWGTYQALVGGSCAASSALSLMHGGVAGFAVTVSCESSPHTEANNTFNIYTIGAVATSGVPGDAAYVSRSISVVVTDAP